MPRSKALKTAQKLLPSGYQPYWNFYQHPTNAHYDGRTFSIEEGNIQICSLSSGFYDLGIKPLADKIKTKGVKHIWLCDDLSASDEPEILKEWLQNLENNGPEHGYKLKAGKCYIVTKDRNASKIFHKELQDGKITAKDYYYYYYYRVA